MTIVVILGVILVVVTVVWFLFGRSPEMAATHEGESLARERIAGRDVAGPADAGAEDMATPAPGEIGPRDTPEPGRQAG